MSAKKAILESFLYCRISEDVRNFPSVLKILVASRLCVLSMTINAVIIAGLIAYINSAFNWPIFLTILAGFTLAHLADNLLNDMTDMAKGIDEPGYFRTLYGPHPIIDGIVTKNEVKIIVSAIILLDLLIAIYLGIKVSYLIPVLAFLGAFIMGLYGGIPIDAKKLGLGEFLVAIVWGPIIIGGTYLALTGTLTSKEALIYTPYALAVMLVLVGKHLDKYNFDKKKNIRTLPIRLGENNARIFASCLALCSIVLATIGLYYYTGSTEGVAVLGALPTVLVGAKHLYKNRPGDKPTGWRVWPLWYAAWGYVVLDAIGRYTIMTLLLYLAGGYIKVLILAVIIAMIALDTKRLLKSP